MNKLQAMQGFLSSSSGLPDIKVFIFNLIMAAVMGVFLGVLYVRFGTALSNRKIFARNFPMLTMTTMFIITVVKSSLALSLGLVGALSIVRFRAAIKEPEELTFLFLAIAIGLGLGAEQFWITLMAFIIIGLGVIFRFSASRHNLQQDMLLTVSSNNPKALTVDRIFDILKNLFSKCSIKRFDETGETVEAIFLVEFAGFDQLNAAKEKLRGLDNSVKISFLDNKGIF
ncbi:MAG: DUF4956 domain-containing protein [Candidatus Omnitrophica bacterium]|nr:DUF4956 domain-containing protein [Candidatus Omnitrophota bacterium]